MSNGRPTKRSRISGRLPSLRVAAGSFIGGGAGPSGTGSARRIAPQASEQLGCRPPGHKRHAHHTPAPPLHLIRSHDRGARAVRALHHDVQPQPLDHGELRLLVEHADAAPRRGVAWGSGGAPRGGATATNGITPHGGANRTPAARPICAKISPTSPRGAIPTPTAARLKRRQGAAHPLTNFPIKAIARRTPAIVRVERFSGTSGFQARRSTAAPTLRKKSGVQISATGLVRSSTRAAWRRSARIKPAANAPMLNAVPPRSANAHIHHAI